MNEQPYTAHDATRENGGVPVWNVKGPGIDCLVHARMRHTSEEDRVMWDAARLAADLNAAYRAGYEAGREGK